MALTAQTTQDFCCCASNCEYVLYLALLFGGHTRIGCMKYMPEMRRESSSCELDYHRSLLSWFFSSLITCDVSESECLAPVGTPSSFLIDTSHIKDPAELQREPFTHLFSSLLLNETVPFSGSNVICIGRGKNCYLYPLSLLNLPHACLVTALATPR